MLRNLILSFNSVVVRRPIERAEQRGRRIKKRESFFTHYTYQVLNQRHEKINYVHNETQTKAAVFTFVSQ